MVGFRDDDGHVRKLQTLDTLKLPGYAARHAGAWDPKTALAFADRVLTELKELFAGARRRAGRACASSTSRGAAARRCAWSWTTASRTSFPPRRGARWRAPPRSAPLAAAPPAAARAAARAAGPQQEPRQRRRGSVGGGSGGGGSVGGGSVGGGSVGGGSVGRPRVGTCVGRDGGVREARGVVFRAPDPKQPRVRPGATLTPRRERLGARARAARAPKPKRNPRAAESVVRGDAAADSSLSKRGVRGGENALRRHDFENAYDTHRSKPIGRANELEDTVASADAFAEVGRHARASPGRLPRNRPRRCRRADERGVAAGVEARRFEAPRSTPAPTARFVHWGVGGSIDESTSGGDGGAMSGVQTPVPGGAALRESRAKDPMAAGAGGGATPPHSTAPSRADRPPPTTPGVPPATAGRWRRRGWSTRRRSRRRTRGRTCLRAAGSRARHKGGAHHSFRHPVVAGPGVGDPFRLAASKLAYARALGPAAMSYLMGFTPGDPGWRGDDAETPRRRRRRLRRVKSEGGVKKRAPPRARPRIRALTPPRTSPGTSSLPTRWVGSSTRRKGAFPPERNPTPARRGIRPILRPRSRRRVCGGEEERVWTRARVRSSEPRREPHRARDGPDCDAREPR